MQHWQAVAKSHVLRTDESNGVCKLGTTSFKWIFPKFSMRDASCQTIFLSSCGMISPICINFIFFQNPNRKIMLTTYVCGSRSNWEWGNIIFRILDELWELSLVKYQRHSSTAEGIINLAHEARFKGSTCISSSRTQIGKLCWRPMCVAADRIGSEATLSFGYWMNCENWASLSTKDIPPLPKELLIWLMKRDLKDVESAVKKHLLCTVSN